MKTGLLKRLAEGRDTRPPGWKTVDELIAEDPMPKTTARRLLNRAVVDGLLDVKKMKSPTGQGFAYRLNYKEVTPT